MLTKSFLSVVSLWCLILSSLAMNVSAQRRSLPADLVMTAAIALPTGPLEERLVWVDAATGNIRELYVDSGSPIPNNSLRPVVWSPNGKFLMIISAKASPDNSMVYNYQLCVITRQGELVVCMVDAPYAPVQSVNANFEDTAKVFTWSADSRLVYFTSEAQGKLRLIEADAMRGNTLRILHEAPFSYSAGTLTWTRDLRVIGENFGGIEYSVTKINPMLIDQQTKTRQSPFVASTDLAEDRYYSVIVSPKNNYFIAIRVATTYGKSMEIIDLAGQVVHKIGGDGGVGVWEQLYSPAWSPDEKFLYFLGAGEKYPVGIYGYDLETRQVFTAYLRPAHIDPGSPSEIITEFFVVSPDNTAIAGRGRDAPPNGGSQVRVVYFDGTSEALLGRYSRTQHALWVPPVVE